MKNKNVYLLLLLFVNASVLISCYTPRYVYSPAAHNVPVLVKKGDTKLAFNYSLNLADNNQQQNVAVTGKARGYDLQAAYALTNHWAIQVNNFNRTERNGGDFDAGQRDSVVINYKRKLTEIAAGYYQALNDNKRAMFQIFGGVGFGKFSFTDIGRNQNNVFHNRYHIMNVTKLFIQPALIVRGKRNFAASFSSRHSLIYFKKINTDYTPTELNNYRLDSLAVSPRLFWEPSMVYNFGFKKIPGLQLEFQSGFAFLISRRFADARFFNFSAGAVLDLPKLFAIKKRSAKN